MLMTKRRPASVGEVLAEELKEPLGLTQASPRHGHGRAPQTRQ